jgi:hypothetical protein
MIYTLIGFLFFSLNAYSINTEFPVPCEFKCVPINDKFDTSFILRVKWENGKKEKDYYLLNSNIENRIDLKRDELRAAEIELSVYNQTGIFTIYLKGQEGDISSIPKVLRETMISSEDFLALPQVSTKNKKRCDLKAYLYNDKNQIITQSLAATNDQLSDIFYKIIKIAVDGSVYTEINVITNTKSILPFAEEMIKNRLKELKDIGLCINSRQ